MFIDAGFVFLFFLLIFLPCWLLPTMYVISRFMVFVGTSGANNKWKPPTT